MKTSDIKVDYIGHFGSDLEVVNAARVSMDKVSLGMANADGHMDGTLTQQDEKLISYLAKHKHFSPFNHAFLSFRVKAPLSAARQLVKHKFLPWNEESRRYIDSDPEFYFPDYYRKRGENVKQGSKEEDSGYSLEEAKCHTSNCLLEYKHRLEHGVAPEQARDALPLNTMTNWIWSGSLGAFLEMLVLRLDPHTQYESRIVAQAIAEHVQWLFPHSYKARIND